MRKKSLSDLRDIPESSRTTIEANKIDKLKLEVEFYSIDKEISFFKLFCYCYCYIGILTGPYFKYRTYIDWLNFKHSNNIDHVKLMFKRGYTLPYIVIGFLALSQFVNFKVIYASYFEAI